MIFNIKNHKLLREKAIIGIFDLDSSTISVYTRSFLKNGEKTGTLENISDLPKSFVLADDKAVRNNRGGNINIKNIKYSRGRQKIYFSKKTVKSIIQTYKNKECEGKLN